MANPLALSLDLSLAEKASPSSASPARATTPSSPSRASPHPMRNRATPILSPRGGILSSAALLSTFIGAKIEQKDADDYLQAVANYEDTLKELPKDVELKDMIFFPEDDISVIQQTRGSRTVGVAPPTPRGGQKALTVDTMFRECYSELTADLFVVKRNYEHFGGKRPVVSNGPLSTTPPWPDSEALGHNSENVPLIQNFVDDYKPEEAKKRDKHDREQNRRDIFAAYSVVRPESESQPTDPRILGEPFSPKTPLRVMVTFKKFLPTLGSIEPFYGSMTLLDIGKGKKLAETFYFDMTEEQFPGLNNSESEKIPTKSAIFGITEPHPDIFLIVRVEKLLAPFEGDAIVEPYMKNALKPKEKDKLLREIDTSMKHLSKYRQGFAWSYQPLFNADGSFLPGETSLLPFTRMKSTHTDREVCETIQKAIQKSKGAKKPLTTPVFSKPIPGEFIFEMKTLKPEDDIPGRLDPSLSPVLPVSEATEKAPIRELREFDLPKLWPHSEVVHDLYIYPESLNFSKHRDGKVKNISMSVGLKEKHRDAPIKVLYEKGTQLKTHFHCTVSYNKKTPVFYDEVKIRLPVTVHDEQIVFSFHNVQCPVKHPDHPIEREIGTAFLPLYSDQNRILQDGPVSLPVIYDHKWLDSKKPLLNVQVRLVSTLVAQEERLHSLLELYQLGVEDNFMSVAFKEIDHISDGLLMQFFLPLMKVITTLLCRDEISTVALLAMLHLLGVVARVSGVEKNSRVPILTSYASYHFRITGTTLFHHKLIKVWLALIEQKFEGMNDLASFSWFLFEILAKSLALHLQAEDKLKGDRKDRVSQEFLQDLTIFIKWCATSVNQRAFGQDVTPLFNINVAFLLKDLFSLLDRGYVQCLVFYYVSLLNPTNDKLPVVKDKFAFLRVIVDFEHFIPLNLPVQLDVSDVLHSLWKAHFLIGLLLHEIGSCMNSSDADIRGKAISTLRDLLWKHDLDPRYQDLKKKQRIAGLYFPLVLMVIEKIVQIRDSDKKEEKRDILACFLFVIKNCDRNAFLRKWWSNDAAKNQLRFATTLSTCLEVFEDLAMSREVSQTVLDILEDFIEDKEADLLQPNNPLMETVFNAFILLLKKDNSIPFVLCLFASICRFIHTFKHTIFVSRNTSFCGDLCYELLRYANAEHGVARSAAGAIFFLMMKTNLKETSNFSRMRLQLTVAMSKFVGNGNQKEYKNTFSTLDQIASFAKTESVGSLAALGQHVEDLKLKLLKLIEDSLKIRVHDYDPEMTSDLYYQFSTFYFESPDLRVAWLENLSCYQRDRNNWEEAAQCKLFIAGLIAEYITYVNGKPKEGIPPTKQLFSLVAPCISGELGLPSVDISKAEEEGMYNTKTFSEEGFIDHLTVAIKYLKRSAAFEACIDVYDFLVELYETRRDYVQLSSCFRDLKTICDAVHATTQVGRIMPAYYWVMFYGPTWGDYEGKSFIYKDPKGNTHYADIVERFIKQFSAKYKMQSLKPLQPKRGPIELDKLQPNMCYFHIEQVSEYFTSEELADRLTAWERKFNLKRFLFEMPYTKSGKPSSDLLDQYKQKTILTVAKSFPYVNTRLPVVEKEVIVITPIETAIDSTAKRVSTVKASLAAKPVDIASLRTHLQECVSKASTFATPGVIQSFFGNRPSGTEFPAELMAELQKQLNELVTIVGVAIKLSKQLIGPEEQESQEQLEGDFNLIKQRWAEVSKGGKAAGGASPEPKKSPADQSPIRHSSSESSPKKSGSEPKVSGSPKITITDS